MNGIRVSVIMPAWNVARYIGEALDSIRRQRFVDYELVVVDDGSTDGSGALLDAAAVADRRVRVVRHAQNRGLLAALNSALEVATGEWVARMDGDDTATPERLERQVDVMANHPELVLLGSAYKVMYEDGRFWRSQSMPATDTAIRWRLLFDNPINHTSAMFRRLLPDGTPVRYEAFRCEDYDLWARLLRHGRGRNLPEPLVTRREHGETYTIREAGPQAEARADIAWREIKRVHAESGLSRADVLRIHRWDDELPAILGTEEIRLCREIADLLGAFGRRSEVDTGEARAIARKWVARILASLPDYRYRHAWRVGLLPRLLRLAPRRVGADMIKRVAMRGRRSATDGGGEKQQNSRM